MPSVWLASKCGLSCRVSMILQHPLHGWYSHEVLWYGLNFFNLLSPCLLWNTCNFLLPGSTYPLAEPLAGHKQEAQAFLFSVTFTWSMGNSRILDMLTNRRAACHCCSSKLPVFRILASGRPQGLCWLWPANSKDIFRSAFPKIVWVGPTDSCSSVAKQLEGDTSWRHF